MGLILIWALVFALYYRTLGYNYIIDDIVKRGDYLYNVPMEAPPADFFHTRPSKWYRLFMIFTHCVNVTAVYAIFGWAAALLFAVHPLSVVVTAWVTGNYYATTALFTLTSFYFIQNFGLLGALAGVTFYIAALNSTINALTFPFLFLFIHPWGLLTFAPLLAYLKGDRFTKGIAIRRSFSHNKAVDYSFTPKRLVLMTKVVARYIHLICLPNELGFFRPFGSEIKDKQQKYDWHHSCNHEFWISLGLCVSVAVAGLVIHPLATVWFFAFMLLHSQWNLTGQFFAERYCYLPMVGFCGLLGAIIQPYPIVVAIIATAYTVRTIRYIPAWKNMECLWKNGVENFPYDAQAWNNYAQYHLNGGPMAPEDINLVASWLLKAERMKPDSWEVHMNLACFYTIVNNLPLALKYTKSSKALLIPKGGLTLPVEKLERQEKVMENLIKQRGLANSFTPKQKGEKRNGKKSRKQTAGAA